MDVLTFWALTPRETMMAMEATAWQADVQRRKDAWLAWHIAALSKAKRLPPLARLINPPKAKKLSGAELEKRRAEHAEMLAGLPAHLRRDSSTRAHKKQ